MHATYYYGSEQEIHCFNGGALFFLGKALEVLAEGLGAGLISKISFALGWFGAFYSGADFSSCK